MHTLFLLGRILRDIYFSSIDRIVREIDTLENERINEMLSLLILKLPAKPYLIHPFVATDNGYEV